MNKNKLYNLSILNFIILFHSSFVYSAEKSDWGVKLTNWILTQASALSIAAIVIIIVPLIFKRQWSALIGTIFGSGIALFFINQPETLKEIGQVLYEIIFE